MPIASTYQQDFPHGTSSGTIYGVSVPSGAAIWVFVGVNVSTSGFTTLADSLGAFPAGTNPVKHLPSSGGSPPGLNLYVADNCPGGTDNITFTNSSGTATSVIVLVITGQGTPSLRSTGAGGQGTSGSFSDSLTYSHQNDIYLLAGAVVMTSAPGTWTGASGSSIVDSTPGLDYISIGLFDQSFTGDGAISIAGGVSAPGLTEVTYFSAIVAMQEPPWRGLAGKPFLTVSPVGLTQTGIINGGADFGPDTPSTQTNGIQEALNFVGQAGGAPPALSGPASVGASSGSPSLSTPAQAVSTGSSMYVQVAMFGSSLTEPTVADNQSGSYALIFGGAYGRVNMWVFRRTSGLSESTSFIVTVTPSSSTSPIEVAAISVLNDGGVDAASPFVYGGGTTEGVTLHTLAANDIVLFLGADNSATFTNWGSTAQVNIGGYPGTPPPNITAWGSIQTQTAPGTVSPQRDILASTAWVGIGIAIRALLPGGTVRCRPGAYILNGPIWNTGNGQTVIFEPGASITFASATVANYQNWWGDIADIWVGCNYTTVKGTQSTFHDCRWIGNGTVINCSGIQTVGASSGGEIVFAIFAYQTLAKFGISVPPAYNIVVEGFTANGFGGTSLDLSSNFLGTGATLSQQWSRVRISRFIATMKLNSATQTSYANGFILSGCSGVEVEDVYIDCSNVGIGSSPDVSNCFVTSSFGGDTENVVFRRCYFKSGGGVSGAYPGSCIEVAGQGSGPSVSYGDTHDIVWEDCLFDSGATSGTPGAGNGGAYIDDTNGGSGGSRVYNLEFRRCQWIHCGMNLLSEGSTPGFILFSGPAPGSISGSLQGRLILQSLPGAPLPPPLTLVTQLRSQLTTTTTTLVSYTPLAVGLFRISVYLTAYAADTPTITVTWTDPDTGAQSTPFSMAMALNSVATEALIVVAATTAAIIVKGSQLGSSEAIIASVTIEQVQ
jgi:hypothetical protein